MYNIKTYHFLRMYIVLWTVGYILSIAEGTVVHGHKLEGFVLKSIIRGSFKDCAKECHRRPTCLSINYNRRLKLCEINSVSPLEMNSLKFDKHWDFSTINSDNLIDVGNCNNHNCETGQVCVELTAGYECKNEGATPSTLNLDNGFVKGNMNDDGSKIAFECSPSYVLDGPRISTFSEITGWSDMPVCEKPCPPPNFIIVSRFLQIIQAVILSAGNGHTIYTGPDYSGVSQTLDIKTSSRITLQCGSTTTELASVNITCNAGVWYLKPDCSPGGVSCDLQTSCTNEITVPCLNEVCLCPLGTSYSYSQQLCVPRCPGQFANTFTKFPGVGVHNGEWIRLPGVTFRQCVDTCLQTPSCSSFEYGQTQGWACVIRQDVLADKIADKFSWDAGNFYQRDCM